MRRMTFSTAWALFSTSILAVALLVLDMQRDQSRELRQQARQLFRRTLAPQKGTYLPIVRSPGVRGDSVTVGQSPMGKSQTIFFLTTTCPHCLRSVAGWKQVASGAKATSRGSAEIVWVFLDSTAAPLSYLKEHSIEDPAVAISDIRLRSQFRIGAVPLTLVVDGRGRVIYSRLDAIEDRRAVDSVVNAIVAASPSDRGTASAGQSG